MPDDSVQRRVALVVLRVHIHIPAGQHVEEAAHLGVQEAVRVVDHVVQEVAPGLRVPQVRILAGLQVLPHRLQDGLPAAADHHLVHFRLAEVHGDAAVWWV